MSKKRITNTSGIIYSTNPDFRIDDNFEPQLETLEPARQKLILRRDTKQRAGKAVTTIEGFAGTQEALEELGRKLKTFCGSGGAVKDGVIIIQGDQREKLVQWLQSNGYENAKIK